MITAARVCVCRTTTGLDADGRCRRHPVTTWPDDEPPEDGLFPAPAPPGITPRDLDHPDPAWRAAARSRRTS